MKIKKNITNLFNKLFGLKTDDDCSASSDKKVYNEAEIERDRAAYELECAKAVDKVRKENFDSYRINCDAITSDGNDNDFHTLDTTQVKCVVVFDWSDKNVSYGTVNFNKLTPVFEGVGVVCQKVVGSEGKEFVRKPNSLLERKYRTCDDDLIRVNRLMFWRQGYRIYKTQNGNYVVGNYAGTKLFMLTKTEDINSYVNSVNNIIATATNPRTEYDEKSLYDVCLSKDETKVMFAKVLVNHLSESQHEFFANMKEL